MTVIAIPHAAHWGTFDAVVEDGRVIGVRPFARDPFPGTLIESVPDIVHARLPDRPPLCPQGLAGGRPARRAARRRRLRAGLLGPRRSAWWPRRPRRVRAEHGPTSIFGGSYGWSSAGRFHHARTQLQRFLGLGGGYHRAGQRLFLRGGAGADAACRSARTRCCWAAPPTGRRSSRHAKVMLCLGGLPLKNGAGDLGRRGRARQRDQPARARPRPGCASSRSRPTAPTCRTGCEAEWMPIRPGTDTALLLAMAHVIVEPRAGRTAPSSRRHCVGWDRLRAYILGETDGIAEDARLGRADHHHPGRSHPRAWRCELAAHAGHADRHLVAAARRLRRAALLDAGRARRDARQASASPGEGVAFGYGSVNGMGNPRREVPSFAMPAGAQPDRRLHPRRAHHRHAGAARRRLRLQRARISATPTRASSGGPAATRSTTTRT